MDSEHVSGARHSRAHHFSASSLFSGLTSFEALGFEWDPLAALWEKMFSELVRFKEEHGHCNIPFEWSKNPPLGNWAANQRAFYRRGKLSSDRVDRLEEIGFRF